MKLVMPARKGPTPAQLWLPPGSPVTEAKHRGIDIGWGAGDEILAALPGTVLSIYDAGGYNGGWGNRVILDHGYDIFTGYAHIANGTFGVSRGQAVGSQLQLARMGDTGEATAKHLHFELMLGGPGPANRVDPMPYFSIDLPGTGTPVDPGVGRAVRKVKNPVGDGYVNGRLSPVIDSRDIPQRLRAGTIGTFDGFIRGQEVTVQGTRSNIWYRGAFNGNYFAAAGFETQDTSGLADLGTFGGAPAVQLAQYVRITKAWFYYTTLANALKGNKAYATGLLAPSDYRVLPNGVSKEGPIQVATTSVGNVWLGTRNTRPPVVWK